MLAHIVVQRQFAALHQQHHRKRRELLRRRTDISACVDLERYPVRKVRHTVRPGENGLAILEHRDHRPGRVLPVVGGQELVRQFPRIRGNGLEAIQCDDEIPRLLLDRDHLDLVGALRICLELEPLETSIRPIDGPHHPAIRPENAHDDVHRDLVHSTPHEVVGLRVQHIAHGVTRVQGCAQSIASLEGRILGRDVRGHGQRCEEEEGAEHGGLSFEEIQVRARVEHGWTILLVAGPNNRRGSRGAD